MSAGVAYGDLSEHFGKTYGSWTVVGEGLPLKNGARRLTCQCVCGLRVDRAVGIMVSGRTKSCVKCAMRAKARAMAGEHFGLWTVIGTGEYKGAVRCECKCECGKIALIPPARLRRGASTKCLRCAGIAVWKKKPGTRMYPWIMSWKAARYRAIDNGLDFTITADEIHDMFDRQAGFCALSGMPIGFAPTMAEHQRRAMSTASLDRIDSARGYVLDNVQWVHREINWAKLDTPQDKFIAMCRAVAKHNPEGGP